jgi:hypothetical protein
VRIADKDGHPLCVDKVGHLTRSFAATAEATREEILAGTGRVLRDLHEIGVEAYLNYGALLGAVRDGAMIVHDSDTDLCYYSRHTSPADIVAESYRVERGLTARGWRLLRLSGADLKVLLELGDGRICHVDVFAAFHLDGVFYQFGNRSGPLPPEAVVPLSTVDLHGHAFPAPADPEAMLAFLYGPGWRVPDPSFRYRDPLPGVRRLDGWFRGFRTRMPEWGTYWDDPASPQPEEESEFARWVHGRTSPGDAIVEFGAGNGADAVFFARHDRTVLATDYSRVVLPRLRARARRHRAGLGTRLRAEHLFLGDLRHALWLGARLARRRQHLYARQLVGCLDPAERANLWRIASMALRRGGRLHLEFSAPAFAARSPAPEGLVQRVDPRTVVAEIEAAGGAVELLEVGRGVDLAGRDDPAVCRLVASWSTPPAPPLHAVRPEGTPA